jgi:hypothetical protein
MRDIGKGGSGYTGRVAIDIGYKGPGSGYGRAHIQTDADGCFDWALPPGAVQVYFSSQTAGGRVHLIDEGSYPKLWAPADGAARYTPVHVAAITGRLRGIVQALHRR